MGARATLVLVDEAGRRRMFYAHWGAHALDRALAPGLEAAMRYLETQKAIPPERLVEDPTAGWLDDVWAEGGALVDVRARRVLYFTARDDDVLAFQRVTLLVLGRTFPGWSIDYAFDGLGDLASELGFDVSVVRDVFPHPVPVEDRLAALDDDDEDDAVDVLTVRHGPGRTDVYPLSRQTGGHLGWLGPTLLAELPAPPEHPVLRVPPVSGLHLDVPDRSVGAWTAVAQPGLRAALPQIWSGWRTDFWRDGYERHAERAGTVSFPPPDLMAAADELERSVLQHEQLESAERRAFQAAMQEVRTEVRRAR